MRTYPIPTKYSARCAFVPFDFYFRFIPDVTTSTFAPVDDGAYRYVMATASDGTYLPGVYWRFPKRHGILENSTYQARVLCVAQEFIEDSTTFAALYPDLMPISSYARLCIVASKHGYFKTPADVSPANDMLLPF